MAERERADELAESARSFTGRMLRKLKIQKLAPELLEERGPVQFEPDSE